MAAIIPNFASCSAELEKHPTQKPLELVVKLVERTKASTILDPYSGSGTTAIACIRTGRKFIGIEIDPGYFKIACDRITRELQQQTLAL